MSVKITPNQPIIILVRGLPGSGKTYIAKRLRKTLGESHVVMLDPDDTDYTSREYIEHSKAQTAEGVDKKLHPYRFLRSNAYKGIESDKIIIWNQPFTNLEIFHKMVGRLREHAAEHNKKLAILVVEVEIDRELAKQRVDSRKQQGGHGPSDDTFNRFVDDYKSFEGEGFEIASVSGQDVVDASVQKIIKAIEKLRN
jgi:adenylate kinase family enzyme